MKEFLRKNIVIFSVIGTTLVLAVVAVVTATRLNQLKDENVAPNAPESQIQAATGPLTIQPKSGNWNRPDVFIVKNTSNSSVTFKYNLDCWDESVCKDKEENGSLTLAPDQTVEKGLGNICSKWQLDLNWSGKPQGQWDWGAVSEKSTDCGTTGGNSCSLSFSISTSGTASPTAKASASPTSSPTASPTAKATATPTSTATATPTATPTEPPRGGNPTPTPTPTPTSTATAKASSSPTVKPSTVASASPSAPALPNAGVGTPTVLVVAMGMLLLLGALLLAL